VVHPTGSQELEPNAARIPAGQSPDGVLSRQPAPPVSGMKPSGQDAAVTVLGGGALVSWLELHAASATTNAPASFARRARSICPAVRLSPKASKG
jgi:hypothetical protein